jgi:hypothetical protein
MSRASRHARTNAVSNYGAQLDVPFEDVLFERQPRRRQALLAAPDL